MTKEVVVMAPSIDDNNDPVGPDHQRGSSDEAETLTAEQQRWLSCIREARSKVPELSILSDEEVEHYAIVTKGSVDEAILRLREVEALSKMYELCKDDELEDDDYHHEGMTMPYDKNVLTAEEREWAVAIKTAAMNDPELLPLTDLEYVQHALVAKDKVKKALRRIRKVQNLKDKYGFGQGDVFNEEKIMEVCKDCLYNYQPGMCSWFGVDKKGRSFFILDYSKIRPERFLQDEASRTLCVEALYYWLEACSDSIAKIRNGNVSIFVSEPAALKNFSLEFESMKLNLFVGCYPVRIKENAVVNGPMVTSALVGTVKVFMPKKLRETIHINRKADDYLKPRRDVFPPEILPKSLGGTADTMSDDEVLLEVRKCIRNRIALAKSFRL